MIKDASARQDQLKVDGKSPSVEAEMARHETTLTSSYVPGWGVWEGVRDFAQNAKDADDKGYEMNVAYSKKTGRLVMKNQGVTVPKDALLLGYTTKAGDDTQRGQNGEGLALSMLALVRAGLGVTVYSGETRLKPTIEPSKTFDSDVLVITTKRVKNPKASFEVQISGLCQEDWATIRKRLLWLEPVADRVSVYGGDVITDPSRKGFVYAKGIYVGKVPDAEYGYDFDSIKLDRDRNMPEPWDLRWKMASMLAEAMASKSPDTLLELSEKGAADVASLAASASARTKEAVAGAFVKKYGEQAVLCISQAEAESVTASGGKSVVVPRRVHETIGGHVDDAASFLDKKAGTIERTHHRSVLRQAHADVLDTVGSAISPVATVFIEAADIAGRRLVVKIDAGMTFVAIDLKTLDDGALTVATEVAVALAENGVVSHRDVIAGLCAQIVPSEEDIASALSDIAGMA